MMGSRRGFPGGRKHLFLGFLTLTLLFGWLPTRSAAATSAQIRVNVVGYINTAPARAYLMASRDGPNYIANALLTAPGHLNDQNAMTYLTPNYNAGSGRFSGDVTSLGVTIDASGGWWDAGDYLKFTGNESYSDIMLLLGVRD